MDNGPAGDDRWILEHVRLYLEARKSGDAKACQEHLYEFCWHLSVRLNDPLWAAGWPRENLLDDILWTADPVVQDGRIDWEGIAVWIKPKLLFEQWQEPFAGSIFFSSDLTALLGWRMRLGDRVRGFGQVSYPGPVGPLPEEWMFILVKAPAEALRQNGRR
jgi:hypothetical protein